MLYVLFSFLDRRLSFFFTGRGQLPHFTSSSVHLPAYPPAAAAALQAQRISYTAVPILGATRLNAIARENYMVDSSTAATSPEPEVPNSIAFPAPSGPTS